MTYTKVQSELEKKFSCESIPDQKGYRVAALYYLTPGVGAPCPVLVPGFFSEVPGPDGY